MTKAETREMKPGLYRIWWKDGGCSIAAVGVLSNGDKWLAPTNWVHPTEEQGVWRMVRSAVQVYASEVSNA